ncbi:MAG: sulfite exporter TauE/SafE family protein [Clostridia bacterium]|nr:sulfite exporter TauE/SafE family protein [Clostridia bacterium]
MPADISLDIILFLTCVFAAFMQASTGFGFSIIIMAIWPLFMPMTDAVFLQLVAGLFAVGYITVKDWKFINFDIIWLPLILALGGSYLGLTLLIETVNAKAVFLLGLMLVLLSLYFILFRKRIVVPNNWRSAGIAGISSGLMSGFFNISGPPVVLYYNVACRDKMEYRASLQFFFMILIIFKIILMLFNRSFSDSILPSIPVVILASIAGIFLGTKMFHRIPGKQLEKVVFSLMMLSGFWYMAKYFI